MSIFRKKFYKKLLNDKQNDHVHTPTDSHLNKDPLKENLQENLDSIMQEFGHSSDFVSRKFILGHPRSIYVVALYIDGLANEDMVNELITHAHSLSLESAELLEIEENEKSYIENTFNLTREMVSTVGNVIVVTDYRTVISSLLNGNTILLFQGMNHGLIVSTLGSNYRAITEPTSETVVKGSKEGFIESVSENTAMMRRRLKTGKLRVERRKMGDLSNTDIAIMYIDGIVNDKVLDEVKERLNNINAEAILESNHIEELIEEKRITLFPTVLSTERPDRLSRILTEGKIAIFVEGTPFALVVPNVFPDFLKSTEDYTSRYSISSLIRILRYITFHFSLFSSPIYIALITYHQEIIPTHFLISLMAQREGVPYPALIEAMLLEITFEILREAGVRIPRAIGPTISIAGALVIGDAAVSAGLVSPAMTIIVALTAISNFTIPSYTLANTTRILRFSFMIVASISGLFGVALGYFIMMAHLCSLRSFGLHYLSPFAPFYLAGNKDAILRFPFSLLEKKKKANTFKNE
ncbi:spore germination protein [Halalkalibacter lacteus]|uniref:spore germination protein n=1 Tax=Halalkalibacter lacteus TaxID=3090663 RepID=UPI002FCA12EB